MRVLVDTSVWIEYFRPRSDFSEATLGFLSLLLKDDRAAIIHPIRAELLSGRPSAEKTKTIREALEALPYVDADWNAPPVWDRIVEMANLARKGSLPVPGIVDRMILAAAEKAQVSLWSLDRTLNRLAAEIGIPLFS